MPRLMATMPAVPIVGQGLAVEAGDARRRPPPAGDDDGAPSGRRPPAGRPVDQVREERLFAEANAAVNTRLRSRASLGSRATLPRRACRRGASTMA